MRRKYKIQRLFTELGEELQRGRERAGLTQKDVSRELGYSSAQFISNAERGICVLPLKKVRALGKMYNIAPTRITRLILVGTEKKILEAISG